MRQQGVTDSSAASISVESRCNTAEATPHEPVASSATARPRINSGQILKGCNEVEIDHGGALYRLRVTSLGKLILTK